MVKQAGQQAEIVLGLSMCYFTQELHSSNRKQRGIMSKEALVPMTTSEFLLARSALYTSSYEREKMLLQMVTF